MTFEIIKNAEIPAETRGGAAIYPFASMEIGDGFDVPDDKGKGKNGTSARRNSLGACASCFVRRHNPTAKFTVRRLNETTIRCVRIA